ncbi:DHH family phosphoesterase [Streptococcus dysgalactiae]|nr:DHH family phosphoesterase [Streptococcus dysgalactiae]
MSFSVKTPLKTFDVSLAESSAIVSAPGKIDIVKAWAIFVEQADATAFACAVKKKLSTVSQSAMTVGAILLQVEPIQLV